MFIIITAISFLVIILGVAITLVGDTVSLTNMKVEALTGEVDILEKEMHTLKKRLKTFAKLADTLGYEYVSEAVKELSGMKGIEWDKNTGHILYNETAVLKYSWKKKPENYKTMTNIPKKN